MIEDKREPEYETECIRCYGTGFISVIEDDEEELGSEQCERCDGSGIEPKRFHDRERQDSTK